MSWKIRICQNLIARMERNTRNWPRSIHLKRYRHTCVHYIMFMNNDNRKSVSDAFHFIHDSLFLPIFACHKSHFNGILLAISSFCKYCYAKNTWIDTFFYDLLLWFYVNLIWTNFIDNVVQSQIRITRSQSNACFYA